MITRKKANQTATVTVSREIVAFLARVRGTVDAGRMLTSGDRVLVAVSGGADSVALWRALEMLAGEWSLTVAMVHINYHLRGGASDADEQFCRELAAKSGARIFVRSRRRPQSKTASANLQDWARRVRYTVFASIADREGFDRIAVGHQFDDQVETVAAGLFGGRDSFALGGIRRVRGRVIRPLFDCRRIHILDFLQHLGQEYREDTSNRDTRYLRNLMRHEILPTLRKQYNPRLDEILFRWSGLVAEQTAFLEQAAARWVNRALIGRGERWLGLSLQRLRRADRPLDFYLLREIGRRLEIGNPALGAVLLRRFRHLVSTGEAGRRLSWGAATIELSRTVVTFYRRRPALPRPVEIGLGETAKTGNWGMRVICRVQTKKSGSAIRLPRGAWRFYGDAACISSPVILRGPKMGERITPMGMSGHKKISDILSEAGVPAILRSRAPVLADRKGVFWVVGHRQADRTKVTDHTREILRIDIENMNQTGE